MGISSCDRYEDLVDEMRRSSRIQRLTYDFQVNTKGFVNQIFIRNFLYQDLFAYLEKHANQSIDDIFVAWDIADTILIEVSMHEKLFPKITQRFQLTFLRPSIM